MSGKVRNSNTVKIVGLALSLCLLAGNTHVGLAFAADAGVLTGDVRMTVNPANIKDSLPVPGGNRKVTMALHDVDLQDALRALAQKGGFNVLIDESVVGVVNVDLNNVTIQDALETLKSSGNLVYEVQGKNLMVAEAASTKGQAFKKTTTRIFHLQNANAKVIANFLNTTVFADRAGSASGASSSAGAAGSGGASSSAGGAAAASSGGGASGGPSTALPVTADYNTNSIIVVGDPIDIKVVEEHLAALDQPRMMKTWRLSQANVLDVATSLASSLFNEGQPILQLGGASASGGSASSVGTTPSGLRVTAESISEGTGSAQPSVGAGGTSSGQATVVSSLTLRTRTQATQTIQVSPTGAILLPDTRMNTLTLLGTAEQISMAESLISLLDRKVPQVVLEAALVEISEDTANQFGFATGSNNGKISSGSNNLGTTNSGGNVFANSIGRIANNAGENIFRISSNPSTITRDFFYQINALISKNKAKMLANPTIITSSDNEGVISIVDEFIRSVSVTQGSFGGAASKTYNIGEAGIVLNILPKIGANKMVSLRVKPLVTTVVSTKSDLNGNVVTLLSKRESVAQNVQVSDGETFVIGGLIHNTNSQTVTSNPMLANLPILGALARNTASNKHRSELVIMITPHIINDESELSHTSPSLPGSSMQPANYTGSKNTGDGMVPVSFSGSTQHAPSALPPMMPAQPFNSATNESDPLEGKPFARPLRQPPGSLLPAEMIPAPQPAQPKTSSLPPKHEATFMPASSTSATDAGSDLSDEKIRAIMEKFK
jgi:general secretion pathway protein D